MDRRTFTRSLLLSSVVFPAMLTGPAARANKSDEELEKQFSRIVLMLGASTVVLATFLVLTSRGFWGIDLRNDSPYEASEKLDVGKIPLIGGLFSPSLSKQFAGAPLVGTLYLVGTALILLPIVTLTVLSIFWLTHRDRVYKPDKKLKKMRLKTELTEAQIKAGRVVGQAVQANGILLGIVGPSIFDKIKFIPKS